MQKMHKLIFLDTMQRVREDMPATTPILRKPFPAADLSGITRDIAGGENGTSEEQSEEFRKVSAKSVVRRLA